MGAWTEFRCRVKSSQLPREEIDYIESGLLKLEQVVGQDWLNKHPSHPILKMVKAGLMYAWWFDIAELGHQMDTVKSINHFSKLKKHILQEKKYLAARAELWTAYKLKSVPISFELYPSIGKEPDFKVSNDSIIYGDAIALGPSKGLKNVSAKAKQLIKMESPWVDYLSFEVNTVKRIARRVYEKMIRQLPKTNQCFIIIQGQAGSLLASILSSRVEDLVYDLVPILQEHPNLVLLVLSASFLRDRSFYKTRYRVQSNYVLYKGISAMVFQELTLCITPNNLDSQLPIIKKLVEAFR